METSQSSGELVAGVDHPASIMSRAGAAVAAELIAEALDGEAQP